MTESGFELARSGWELNEFHEVDLRGGCRGEVGEILIGRVGGMPG